MDLQTSHAPEADPRPVTINQRPDQDATGEKGDGDVEHQLSRSTSTIHVPDTDPEKADVAKDDENVDVAPQSHEEKYPNGLVDFDGPDDPDNPRNFSLRKKWAITASMGWMTFVVTFASSIFSVCTESVSEEFGVDRVVATLGVSVFILGFVFGPLVFGPASEAFGRAVPLFIGYFIFGLFQIPVALAKNVTTIMVGRFLGGFASSAPLAIVGGAMSDLWEPIPRAYAICIFAAGAFTGPVAGPVVGSFIVMDKSLGWRWTAWITMIAVGLFGAIGLICIRETSAVRILQLRAKRLHKQTGNISLHTKADETPLTFNRFLTVYLIRPFVMLSLEPILALVTAYMSFLYGVLYLLFVAYPFSFHHQRGWNLGVSSLPFAAFIVGIAAGAGTMALSTRTNFTKAFKKHGKVIPEERLPPVILNAIVLPVGLFIFGWTSSPHITWVPQVIASGLLGMSMLVTFWQCINYLIDCYGFYSNSAISVNTFIRSIAGAVFPLFAWDMYARLGVAWSTSILGFVCVAFIPVPVAFYVYGGRIRERSRFRPPG